MSFNACCTVHDAIAYRVLCGVVFCMYNSHKILYIDFCQKAVVLLRLKDDWDVGDVLSMYHIEPSVLYLVLQSDWGCRIDAGPVDYSGCGGGCLLQLVRIYVVRCGVAYIILEVIGKHCSVLCCLHIGASNWFMMLPWDAYH